MKFFPLVWRNLLRRKVRTIFTLLSVMVAFVLFGILMAFGRLSADREFVALQACGVSSQIDTITNRSSASGS